jgi:hypothetical protein
MIDGNRVFVLKKVLERVPLFRFKKSFGEGFVEGQMIFKASFSGFP